MNFIFKNECKFRHTSSFIGSFLKAPIGKHNERASKKTPDKRELSLGFCPSFDVVKYTTLLVERNARNPRSSLVQLIND